MRRAILRGFGIAALTLASVVSFAGTTVADESDHHPRRHRAYLALGDSLSVGVGSADPAERGYVPLFADHLRSAHHKRNLKTINVGESGATSTSLRHGGQLASALAILEERNGDHRRSNDVVVITIDVGGNDIAPLAPVCAGGFTAACQIAVGTTFGTFAVNFDATLAQLREAAGDDTRIITTTYFNTLVHPACPFNGAAALGSIVLEGGGPLANGLNDIIRATAAAHGVEVAETFGLLGAGDLVGDCLHPNDAGYAKIAAAFEAVHDQ